MRLGHSCSAKSPVPAAAGKGNPPQTPLESKQHKPLVFSQDGFGVQPSPGVPTVGMGCRSHPELRSWNKPLPYPELLPKVCKNPQISNFLPLSHLLLSLLPSPHVLCCSKKQTQREGENLPIKFKDKLQTGQESQPIYYPSAASDAAFPPPETTGLFLSYFSFFFRNFQMPEQPQFSCQDGCTETSFSGSSVLCTFCSLEHSRKKKIKK